MNKIIFPLLLILVIGSFAKAPIKQKVVEDSESSLEALSSEDRVIFNRNWMIAEKLLEQDKMAWIATDSILPILSKNEMNSLRGYLVEGNMQQGAVLFFSENNEDITFIKKGKFINGHYIGFESDFREVNPRTVLAAKCVQKSKKINLDYILRQKVSYNSYSIDNGNEIVVYLAPGSNDDGYAFGGGILTIFDKGLNIIQNKELHKSIINYPVEKIGDVLVRSSSVTTVPNEVDLMQYLVFKNTIYNQLIFTDKYIVVLCFIPDLNKIIKTIDLKD